MARKTILNMDRAIGYIRVSTDEQQLGPEAQRAALRKWSQANCLELTEVHEDLGVSGGTALDKRPGLLAAIEAMSQHGAGVLLVMKRDRLARDTMVSAMVERLVVRSGGRIMTTDGTGNGDGPEAMLMRGIMDVFAQYERALIRCRTTSALAVKKNRGERVGEVPYGFRVAPDGIHIEAREDEQQAITVIRDLSTSGLSIRAIAQHLNADGVPARGSRWHPTTVARLLNKEAG
jgi:DNA invertase Pin-like site-specific DNA recombinase